MNGVKVFIAEKTEFESGYVGFSAGWSVHPLLCPVLGHSCDQTNFADPRYTVIVINLEILWKKKDPCCQGPASFFCKATIK